MRVFANGPVLFVFVVSVEGAISSNLGFAVVRAGIKNLPSHVPSKRTANQHVRGEVLVSSPPRGAYGSGRAVSQYLSKGAGIFVRDHARNRPTD